MKESQFDFEQEIAKVENEYWEQLFLIEERNKLRMRQHKFLGITLLFIVLPVSYFIYHYFFTLSANPSFLITFLLFIPSLYFGILVIKKEKEIRQANQRIK